MTEPVDPPDTEQMHRALTRVHALAGTLADPDIALLKLGIQHQEDTIRGLMDTCTEQHEELLRADLDAMGGRGPGATVNSLETSGAAPLRTAGPVGHSTGGSRE